MPVVGKTFVRSSDTDPSLVGDVSSQPKIYNPVTQRAKSEPQPTAIVDAISKRKKGNCSLPRLIGTRCFQAVCPNYVELTELILEYSYSNYQCYYYTSYLPYTYSIPTVYPR